MSITLHCTSETNQKLKKESRGEVLTCKLDIHTKICFLHIQLIFVFLLLLRKRKKKNSSMQKGGGGGCNP